jgi:hypothetical protein
VLTHTRVAGVVIRLSSASVHRGRSRYPRHAKTRENSVVIVSDEPGSRPSRYEYDTNSGGSSSTARTPAKVSHIERSLFSLESLSSSELTPGSDMARAAKGASRLSRTRAGDPNRQRARTRSGASCARARAR